MYAVCIISPGPLLLLGSLTKIIQFNPQLYKYMTYINAGGLEHVRRRKFHDATEKKECLHVTDLLQPFYARIKVPLAIRVIKAKIQAHQKIIPIVDLLLCIHEKYEDNISTFQKCKVISVSIVRGPTADRVNIEQVYLHLQQPPSVKASRLIGSRLTLQRNTQSYVLLLQKVASGSKVEKGKEVSSSIGCTRWKTP